MYRKRRREKELRHLATKAVEVVKNHDPKSLAKNGEVRDALTELAKLKPDVIEARLCYLVAHEEEA
jgi:hypothetical protein